MTLPSTRNDRTDERERPTSSAGLVYAEHLVPDAGVPAAHSMDSSWFAVDEDGEVAQFHTGEAGALPLNAGIADGYVDTQGDGAERVVAIARALLLEKVADDDDLPPSDGEWPDLLVFTKHAPLPGGVKVVFEGRRTYAMPTKEILHAPAGVLRAYVRPSEDAPTALATYSCDVYDQPGAYAREHPAEGRLFLQDLPPDLAAAASQLKLPVCFSQRAHLHLADLPVGRCETWGEMGLRGQEPDSGPPSQSDGAASPTRGRAHAPSGPRRVSIWWDLLLLIAAVVGLGLVWLLARK